MCTRKNSCEQPKKDTLTFKKKNSSRERKRNNFVLPVIFWREPSSSHAREFRREKDCTSLKCVVFLLSIRLQKIFTERVIGITQQHSPSSLRIGSKLSKKKKRTNKTRIRCNTVLQVAATVFRHGLDSISRRTSSHAHVEERSRGWLGRGGRVTNLSEDSMHSPGQGGRTRPLIALELFRYAMRRRSCKFASVGDAGSRLERTRVKREYRDFGGLWMP